MPNPKYVIEADKDAAHPSALGRLRVRILADEFKVDVAADASNAAVTHRLGTTEGNTFHVSPKPNYYKAVRVYEAASSDGSVIGQMVGGAVVINGKIVTELRILRGAF
jgi:hypothetical protein